MSINAYLPHVLILPEDDANRQIANGFLRALDFAAQTRVRILPPPGGWLRVVERLRSNHLREMDRLPARSMVLLIDFDDRPERLAEVKEQLPASLLSRVFVLGALSEPEKLRSAGLGSYETIGSRVAAECRSDSGEIWSHPQLRHNEGEIARLRGILRPLLFGSAGGE